MKPVALPPRAEAIATVTLGAPLMVPMWHPRVTVICLSALVVLGGYQATSGALRASKSPLGWAWAILLFQALVATAVSSFPSQSVTRLACIIFGSIVLRAMILGVRTKQDCEAVAWLYVVGGGCVAVAGLIGTEWPRPWSGDKISSIAVFALRFPTHLSAIGAEGGANPNAVAAATLFFLPLVAFLLYRTVSNLVITRHQASRITLALEGALAGAVLSGLSFVLVLTQSRSAWLGLAAVATAVLWWAWKSSFARTVIVCSVVAAVVVGGSAIFRDTSNPAAANGLVPATTRPQLWARALHYIWEDPITGIGLDTFRIKAQETSPPFEGGNARDVVHVHNVFLQTALDLGIPGLIAYLVLLWKVATMWLSVDRLGSSSDRFLAVGVAGNLLGVMVFGLYDAVALGTKLSLCFWWNLGLLAALHQRVVLRGEMPS